MDSKNKFWKDSKRGIKEGSEGRKNRMEKERMRKVCK